MNTYNKLLLDEAQAMISLLNKYLDNANLNVEKRQSFTNALEAVVDSLDTAGILVKDALEFNNKFKNCCLLISIIFILSTSCKLLYTIKNLCQVNYF